MTKSTIITEQDVPVGPQGISVDTTRLGSELGGLFIVLLMALVFKYIWKQI